MRRFAAILARGEESGREVEQAVLDIIADVRSAVMRPCSITPGALTGLRRIRSRPSG